MAILPARPKSSIVRRGRLWRIETAVAGPYDAQDISFRQPTRVIQQ
jgi:hypothetical protein